MKRALCTLLIASWAAVGSTTSAASTASATWDTLLDFSGGGLLIHPALFVLTPFHLF